MSVSLTLKRRCGYTQNLTLALQTYIYFPSLLEENRTKQNFSKTIPFPVLLKHFGTFLVRFLSIFYKLVKVMHNYIQSLSGTPGFEGQVTKGLIQAVNVSPSQEDAVRES